MKKYFSVYERKNGDSFGQEVAIDKKEDAIAEAQNHWNHLTNSEKAKTQYAGVLYGEVDGDGCLVMDSAVEIFVPV